MKGKSLILMYHNIGVPPIDAPMKGLYVLPSMFKVQLTLLKIFGFKVVTIKELLLDINKNNNKKLVAITFDDGYYDFYKNALPLLAEFNYTANVFVVASLIGKTNEWDTIRYGGVKEPLMNLDQLREIQQKGIVIGSHSYSHADLTALDEESLKREIGYSKEYLQGLLKTKIETFCYPFGGCNDKAKSIVKEVGYTAGIGSKRGSVKPSDDVYDLRRIPVRLNTHPLLFLYKILTEYEDKKGRRK